MKMAKERMLNEGGINGLGEGLVNTNDKNFKELQAVITKIADNQEEEQRLNNAFLSIRFQMESYLNSTGKAVILAGTFIEKFLQVIKIKKKDFAKYIGYEESNLSALLKGRRKINTDIALKLGRIFKTNPAIWLHIENKNALIRESKGKEKEYEKYSLQDLLERAG